MTVSKQTCDGFFCYRSSGEVETLTGCHNKNDFIDCYWFPCAFGCYSNDCTELSFWDGCAVPSCVICGYDLTLGECYGDYDVHGTDDDLREVKVAQEGIDYRIDSIKVVVNDDLNTLREFLAGNIGFSEFDIFLEEVIRLINFKEATKIDYYIEYTALTELNSAEFGIDVIYKNSREHIYAKAGNALNLEQGNFKSYNISAGKHFMHATVSLDVYELLQFVNFSDATFVAYAYEE
ncbi:MAG: hypothetical protein E7661_05830 [Ruminococcaceae bacterium]|nr:hypothetical protein [Oscillospiraceae bacterium]